MRKMKWRMIRWRTMMLRRNEKEENDDVEDDDVAEEDRSQDRDPQFVRACAIEMHLDISQEPFYATIFRKKTRPTRALHVLRELAQSQCTWTCRKNQFTRKLLGKMPRPKTATSLLCELARSKCIWTCHNNHLTHKFKGKRPQAKTATHTLCESAQSKRTWAKHKNHFARNFVGKKGNQIEHPDQAPASVWTHCLGKKWMRIWGGSSLHSNRPLRCVTFNLYTKYFFNVHQKVKGSHRRK